jgi:hypothetical protein
MKYLLLNGGFFTIKLKTLIIKKNAITNIFKGGGKIGVINKSATATIKIEV